MNWPLLIRIGVILFWVVMGLFFLKDFLGAIFETSNGSPKGFLKVLFVWLSVICIGLIFVFMTNRIIYYQ